MRAVLFLLSLLCVLAPLRETSLAANEPTTIWIQGGAAVRLSGAVSTAARSGIFEDAALGDFLVSTVCVSPDKLDGGFAEYRVKIPRAGRYCVWARLRDPAGRDGSFAFIPTAETPTRYTLRALGGNGPGQHAWHWESAGSGWRALELPAGELAFRIYPRQASNTVFRPAKWRMANPLFSPRLNVLCLTTDAAYVPSDDDACRALKLKPSRYTADRFRVEPVSLPAITPSELDRLGKQSVPDWLRVPRLFTKDSWRFELETRRPGDIAFLVRHIAANEGNAFRLSVYWGGNVFYQSRIAPHAPGLGQLDYLAEATKEGRATGVKILMYANPNALFYDHSLATEAAIRDPGGQPRSLTAYGMEARYACINHPAFRRFFLDVLTEAFKRYELTGLYVDGLSPHRCFCRYCREAYQEMWGEPMPVEKLAKGREAGVFWEMTARAEPVDDPGDPQCRRYTQFLAHSLAEMTRLVSETVKRTRPGAVTLFHSWPKPETMVYYDGTLTEIYLSQPWHHKLWKSQELACYSNIFPVPVLFNIYLHDHGTEAEARLKMFEGLAAGCYPNCWNLLGMREVFGFMRRNAAVLDFATTAPVPVVALVRGVHDDAAQQRVRAAEAKQFRRPGDYFLAPYVGLYSALVRQGIPIVTLQRTDFHQKIARFKVLCLANEACLSGEQVAAVRRFVAAGGGLVASGETSLYNDQGVRRPDFGLADVFGASFQVMLPAAPRRLEARGDHDLVRSLAAGGIEHEEACVAVRPNGAQSLAVLAPVGGQGEPVPGLLVHRFGRGRVVYVPGRLEAIQCRRLVPAIERLFSGAVAWSAGEELPVSVRASAPVSVSLFQQARRRIVHLVSLNGDPEYRSDAVGPAGNVQIELALPADWAQANLHRLWTQADVPYTLHGNRLRARLDRIDPYEVLVLERRD